MFYDEDSKIVVDNIHGDIRLSGAEWKIVNTASFQRLRRLKQLGLGHLTYPNATHTRFAHSLGVFGVMQRILRAPGISLKEEDKADLRLAALLHDIGHYPYSHLMERIDRVTLTEEAVNKSPLTGKTSLEAVEKRYPDHEAVGRLILTKQPDLIKAIGSEERAHRIGQIFSRTEAANQQLSKLIHSSLDMDRLDYLVRDSQATGVPYGMIDLNYLLNNVRISPNGQVGVNQKALAAAEHFLIARLFMYRAVYYHKTTYAFEEACRQLLCRLKKQGAMPIPKNGTEIEEMVSGEKLADFSDAYVDRLIQEAASDASSDAVVKILARCILSRNPPRLLAEVSGLEENRDGAYGRGTGFKSDCRHHIPEMASKYGVPVGRFLICGPKPIKIEERSSLFSLKEAREIVGKEEREELIKVFWNGESEPRSMIDIPDSLTKYCSERAYGIHRLYFAPSDDRDSTLCADLRKEVQLWDSVAGSN